MRRDRLNVALVRFSGWRGHELCRYDDVSEEHRHFQENPASPRFVACTQRNLHFIFHVFHNDTSAYFAVTQTCTAPSLVWRSLETFIVAFP